MLGGAPEAGKPWISCTPELLLHVVDATHPDAATQIRAVDQVLDSISWADRREVLVFNKVDRVGERLALHSLAQGRKNEVSFVSAQTGEVWSA